LGGHRKGKRTRGAAGKVPVFGLLKRQGKVYVAIIANAGPTRLFRSYATRSKPDSVVYTDALGSYDVLDVSEFHHMRINHSRLFADKQNHINGIENFWNQAKLHLRRYNRIPRQHFHLFINECEWRFNYRTIGRIQKTPVRCWFK